MNAVKKLIKDVKNLGTMDVSDTLNPPASHIIRARKIAEEIFSYPPNEQLEIMRTVKAHLLQCATINLEQIKKM